MHLQQVADQVADHVLPAVATKRDQISHHGLVYGRLKVRHLDVDPSGTRGLVDPRGDLL